MFWVSYQPQRFSNWAFERLWDREIWSRCAPHRNIRRGLLRLSREVCVCRAATLPLQTIVTLNHIRRVGTVLHQNSASPRDTSFLHPLVAPSYITSAIWTKQNVFRQAHGARPIKRGICHAERREQAAKSHRAMASAVSVATRHSIHNQRISGSIQFLYQISREYSLHPQPVC